MRSTSLVARFLVLAGAFLVGSTGSAQDEPPAVAVRPGQAVEGVVHQGGREIYRLSFPATGMAVVELSGMPADCALQAGSQGFQDGAPPIDWTEGQPGQAVSHSFHVVAGQSGIVWVELRSRHSAVSLGEWNGMICSPQGPCYTMPQRGGLAPAAPTEFEGRPVRGPITFRLVASLEGTSGVVAPPSTDAGPSQPFVDDQLGFGFDYPEDWVAVGVERGVYRLTGKEDTSATEVDVTIRITPQADRPKGSALAVLLEAHNKLVEDGVEASKLGPTKAGNLSAVFANHTYQARNAQGKTVPFDHALVVLENDTHYYQIAFVAPHDVFVRQTPTFKRVLNTWHFDAHDKQTGRSRP